MSTGRGHREGECAPLASGLGLAADPRRPRIEAPGRRTAWTHWAVRRLLWAGRHRGVRGMPGRLLGSVWGSPIPGGGHLLITDVDEYIQRTVVLDGVYEPTTCWLLRVLLHRHPGAFLDVGANVGLHSLVALSAGARVTSFEPVPRLAARLRRNLERNHATGRVRVVPSAVGDRIGTAPMFLATRADDGSHSLVPGVAASRVEEILVPLTTLDDHLPSCESGPPSVIKIDVEGFEARVLDGAKRILGGHRPPHVLIETGDRLASEIGESASTVLARLVGAGYRLFRVHERPPALEAVDPRDDVSALANYLGVPPWGPTPPRPPREPATRYPWIG